MTTRYTKTIVCLANSRKPPSGRCVAGREVTGQGFGDWVRPVSARPTQEISLEERRYKDGRDPSLLDIIAIEMKSPQPQRHQKENHLIHTDWYWVKQGTVTWQDLQAAVEDPGGSLWLDGYSSYNGWNDRVPEGNLDGLSRSLYLVRPEQLRLVVASEGGDFGPPRRRVRARFTLCGHPYCIVVTDPHTESDFLARHDGEYPMAGALICVSLGEVFHGYAYKLAAAVIPPLRSGTRTMPGFVYTIGHSNHPIEKFIELLSAHNVTAIADVRSHPYSRFNPQFNREKLRTALRTAGVAYAFVGRELGARSEDPNCYVNGKVQYDLLARTPVFKEGLSRLVLGADGHRIVLMCAEKDPLTCHRAILVCRHLVAQGIGAQHILENGRVESHDAALSRLLAELGLDENDLFRSRDEVILEAYDRRGEQIAYSLHVDDEEPAGRWEG